jgi:carboxypeptidase C (cathepsin A)
MRTNGIDRRRALSLAGIALIGGGSVAEAQGQASASTPPGKRPDDAEADTRPLPADVTTHHTIELPGRTLRFDATAGAIRLTGGNYAPPADLAFVSFQLAGADRARRPVTFAFNGGPGFASAWLNVGAVGPWRIAIGGDAPGPSASPEPMPNAETWLDFTDLVFIDPAGTGYSRVPTRSADIRRTLWSVAGDTEYLSEAMRRWLDRFDRDVSPKYLLGESYGGFRAPRLARELATNQGIGVSGMVLLSPALDFGGRSSAFDPFSYVARLPSMTAAARAAKGPVTRAALADVERYAVTDYLVDLARGERDAEAIARRSARVAEFTGLDPALVRRHHGVLSDEVFLHELDRARGRVGSFYDATITIADPFPLDAQADYPDPVLEALKAPVSSAMVEIYETRLNWRPDTDYRLGNADANHQWDWGRGMWNSPQSMSALVTALALDSRVSALIVHGLFDLITPYFGTQLLLDQVSEPSIAARMQLSVHLGGHMVYTDDASRAALHDEAARLFSGG